MILIAAVATCGGSAGTAAAEPAPPLHACDRLAALLWDDARTAEAVPYERLDVGAVTAACREALDAHPGAPRFQLQLARAYEKAGRPDEAIELAERAADQGYAGAQAALGARYWWGEGGVPQSHERAVALLRPAAEQGNSYAQALLALAYLQGSGVDRDLDEAMRWVENSADQGNERGLELLAMLHEEGIGVTRDLAQARRLYARAAARYAELLERGFDFAEDALFLIAARLFEHRYQSVDDIDIGRVRGWIELLAERDHADAQFVLGRMYERGYAAPGYHGTPDLDRAYAWFRRAAANGSREAYERLVDDYGRRLAAGPDDRPVIEGDPLGRPLEEAKAWIRETAEAGRVEAQLVLGRAYHRGYGFERNLDMARTWYARAAAQGSDEARALLEDVQGEVDRRTRLE